MFMGRVNGINLYKHGISRTYLNLDDAGNCFVAGKRGCYVRSDFDQELEKMEKCLKGLQAGLETLYDESFIARKKAILHQQGIHLLTVSVEPGEFVIH
jgi:hypothetical protein